MYVCAFRTCLQNYVQLGAGVWQVVSLCGEDSLQGEPAIQSKAYMMLAYM